MSNNLQKLQTPSTKKSQGLLLTDNRYINTIALLLRVLSQLYIWPWIQQWPT